MLEDFFEPERLGEMCGQIRVATNAIFGARVNWLLQTSCFQLGSRIGRDIKLGWESGADGGVDRGAGESGVLQFRHQLVGRRISLALEGIDERRTRPLIAGQNGGS